MVVTASQLMVMIGGNAAGAQAAITSTAAMMGKTGMLGLAAAAAGAAIAGVGIIATKMAGDLESAMTTIATGAGESADKLGMLKQGVLQLAQETGTSTEQLVSGLYMIESGGFRAQKALDILKAAAEGAKVGNADLGVVADATDTILKNYGEHGMTAANAVNTLIATVAHGKTHMEEFSDSLAHVLPTAAAAGIGLNDVMGAMATMTGQGTKAAEAATYLRQTIVALSAPGTQAQQVLKSVGLSAEQVANDMHKSLPFAIQEITEAVGKKFPVGSAGYIAAIREIAGGMRQMQGMLQLGGDHIKTFSELTGEIAGQVKKGGSSIEGWALVQQTFNQKMSQAGEKVKVLFIELGEKLLPVATKFAAWLGETAIPAITNFVSWITGSGTQLAWLRPILIAVAIAIAGALVAAFVSWAAAAAAAAVATIAATWPILAIGAAIALLIAGIVLLVTHWSQVTAAFQAGIHLAGDLAGKIGEGLGGAFSALGTWLSGVGAQLADWGHTALDGLTFPFRMAVAVVRDELNRARATVQGALDFVLNLFRLLYEHNHYVRDMVNEIGRILLTLRATLVTIVTGIQTWLAQQWATIQAGAQLAWGLVQQHIITPVRTAWATLVSILGGIGGWFRDRFNEVVQHAQQGWDRFLGLIAGLEKRVGTYIHDHIVQPIVDKITGLGGTLLGKGRSVIGQFFDGVIAGIKSFANTEVRGVGNILSWLGFDQATVNALPHFARGGVMAAGGLALVGEEGPELVGLPAGAEVIPTSTLAARVSGGTSIATSSTPIVINIDGYRAAQAIVPHVHKIVRNATGKRNF